MIHNLTLSAILIFCAGPILALPFAVAAWFLLLDSAVADAEIRALQRGRETAVIVRLSQMDKNCLEWRERNGGWLCVRR